VYYSLFIMETMEIMLEELMEKPRWLHWRLLLQYLMETKFVYLFWYFGDGGCLLVNLQKRTYSHMVLGQNISVGERVGCEREGPPWRAWALWPHHGVVLGF
jgi:hypothetical protein